MRTTDHRIDIPQGRLSARSWLPDERDTRATSTILLFRDSLGCVDQWRDFPERLARATRRRVVAYDRLGPSLASKHMTFESPV